MIIDQDLKRCQQWINDHYGVEGGEFTAAIGYEKDGELQCVTGYNHFNGKSCHIHFYLKPGVYVPRNYIWFVHFYPFHQAGVDMLIALMASVNEKILRLAEHLGYSERYRLKDAYPGGDLVLCTMEKQTCRWC